MLQLRSPEPVMLVSQPLEAPPRTLPAAPTAAKCTRVRRVEALRFKPQESVRGVDDETHETGELMDCFFAPLTRQVSENTEH
jgi:hypothetical protein